MVYKHLRWAFPSSNTTYHPGPANPAPDTFGTYRYSQALASSKPCIPKLQQLCLLCPGVRQALATLVSPPTQHITTSPSQRRASAPHQIPFSNSRTPRCPSSELLPPLCASAVHPRCPCTGSARVQESLLAWALHHTSRACAPTQAEGNCSEPQMPAPERPPAAQLGGSRERTAELYPSNPNPRETAAHIFTPPVSGRTAPLRSGETAGYKC